MISGDLTLHKRTLEPIKTLVYGLRRYDVDRCAALISSQGVNVVSMPKVDGFMSHKAKIYLADVYDHMDYIIGSFDMFSNVAENLINFTFNVRSLVLKNYCAQLTNNPLDGILRDEQRNVSIFCDYIAMLVLTAILHCTGAG